MYIKSLKILNFRNIENLEFDLNKNINIFIGKNAQGKTSILESIYVLALTKSMRNVDDNELIKINNDFFKIKCLLEIEKNHQNLEIILKNNQKILKINNNIETKVSKYISIMNVIMFSPDDLDIVKKSPSFRRNLLNIELCQLFSNYLKRLNEYNKILKLRNEYLKKNNNFDEIYFDILTDKLIERAIVIMNYREQFINNININIDKVYYKIMKQNKLHVLYEKNIVYKTKEEIKILFKSNFDNEKNKKLTLFGPHKDDFSFYLNDENLKIYGSQGQQRIAILSFKLSEIKLFKETKNSYPIVLLDDIFSELDIEKRNNLLKFIKSNIQFIITTTDIKNISSKIIDRASIFKIKDGKMTR